MQNRGAGGLETPLLDTVFYTPDVVNAPSAIASGIRFARDTLRDLARRPARQEREQLLESIRRRDEEHRAELHTTHDWLSEPFPELEPACGEVAREYGVKDARIADPTTLIRIGMPGLEKRSARYAQFYSGIGFVHEFRALGTTEIRRLLAQRWTPTGGEPT